jgi:hypothetical protein
MATPRTWEPNVEPTPEQLAAWLVACTDEERVTFAKRAIEAARTEWHCVLMNHEGRIADMVRERANAAR